ncbi:MAG: ABC transporter permease [Lachnospiraceae bacterium]|nr:ABC transporter permease [Lachnospiraceae bacterium]
MIFRMIKKDLTESKGLNVIVLLFMIIVSVLITASSLLLFANIRGIGVSRQRCKPYTAIVIYDQMLSEAEEQRETYKRLAKEAIPDAQFGFDEGISLEYTNVEFPGMNLDTINRSWDPHMHYLMKQPREYNLVYDIGNMPFSLKSGEMAIPYAFAKEQNLKTGDAFFITAPNGHKFELTIAYITRDPIHDAIFRFLISDEDYELLSGEFPQKVGVLGLVSEEVNDLDALRQIGSDINKDKKYGKYYSMGLPDGHSTSNAALVSLLITLFLSITALFMLLIVFFTIGFTIRSVIRKEERELGIMKALGADSLSFRGLVSAKYIAFALVGGTAGVLLGIPVGKELIGQFYYNISYRLGFVDHMIAVLSGLMVIGIVILFILYSMRRISKISVMEILRGEAREDRVRHSDRFHLTRRKLMPLPLFLALTDLFGGFKRYILLLIAFTIGSIVVIMNIQIRDSVISTDFLYKFYNYKELEAVPNVDQATLRDLSQNSGDADIFRRNFNKMMEKNDIPLTIEIAKSQGARMVFGETSEAILLHFGFDPEGMVIRSGSAYPKLENEVLIDYHTAEAHHLKIGDQVTIEYEKYTPDRLSSDQMRDTFYITGFVDRLSNFNDKDVIMAEAFRDAVPDGWNPVGVTIDAPESEKPAIVERLKELLPGQVMSSEELISNGLGMYDVLFSFLRNMMIIVVTGVLGFLTVMYQTLFMKDDESEIALLKSSGFGNGTTGLWQFLRMMILVVIGMVLSVIITPTLVAYLLGAAFNMMIGITGFTFTRGVGLSFLWVVFIILVIGAVVALVLKNIDKIEIGRIRNE